jgi:putative flavoprotein involved in K+ transport
MALEWLGKFEGAGASGETRAIESLFHPDGYWRDILALHWDLRTFAGRTRIAGAWRDALKQRTVSDIRLEDGKIAVFERKKWGPTVEAFFTFETDIARCCVHLRLLAPKDGGDAWNG